MEVYMFNKIKYILFKYNLNNAKNIYDKINLIKASNIDLTIINDVIPTLTKDIVVYIDELKYLTDDEIYTTKKNIKNINSNSILNKRISLWMTNDGYLINDNYNALIEWLDLSELLLNIYDISKTNNQDINLKTNMYRVSPYIKNINDIIDTIFKHI